MAIIDLANNDDASILPPNLYSPLFPPSNVIAPSIYFSNSDGGWGVWGLDVVSRGRGLWRGLQVGVAVTNHRTIMADTNRSSNSGPAQQWKLFIAASPPSPRSLLWLWERDGTRNSQGTVRVGSQPPKPQLLVLILVVIFFFQILEDIHCVHQIVDLELCCRVKRKLFYK